MKNTIIKTTRSLDKFKFTYGVVSSLGDISCSYMEIGIHCSPKSKVGSSIKTTSKKFEKHLEDAFNQSDPDDFDSSYNPNPFQFDYFYDVTREDYEMVTSGNKGPVDNDPLPFSN